MVDFSMAVQTQEEIDAILEEVARIFVHYQYKDRADEARKLRELETQKKAE